MSAPLRFLTVVVVGWGVVRAATLGAIPGFTLSAKQQPLLPPLAPTDFSDLAPGASVPVPAGAPMMSAADYAQQQVALPPLRYAIPYYVPVYVSVPAPSSVAAEAIPPRPAWSLPSARAPARLDGYPSLPPIPLLAGLSGANFPAGESTPVPEVITGAPAPARLDRWQMSSWALLRGPPVPGALASGGELGGSQAGARILYNFTRSLAASLRMTSPVGGSRGAEIAAGVRWIPVRSLPLAITAERRQSISPHGGGRSDFALFAEGGVYRRRLPLGFRLDGYAQAGIVGVKRHDVFADGQLAVTRPLFGRISAGMGVWGGYQPGLYRVDAGPRVSVKVRDNIYADVDWRQRLAGAAQPGSGPALTVGADF